MDGTIALCYDLKVDYLAAGFTPEQVMELDDEEVVAGLEGALTSLGFSVERVGRGAELARLLIAGRRWDLVFNITEGIFGRGREAQVPALCELFDQPYTFSDPVTCGITLDKAWTKRLVRDAGMPTAPFAVIQCLEDAEAVDLPLPLFIKPRAEGSSMGIEGPSLVLERASLVPLCLQMLPMFPAGLLVETYLEGREVTVGVVGCGASARPVAVMEVLYTHRARDRSYTASNKGQYLTNVRYRLLRRGTLARQAIRHALEVYRLLECRDAGRVDLRCDRHGTLQFLEINPLPGLHPVRSDLPIMARLAGIPYVDLLADIVASACERRGRATQARVETIA